MIRFGNRYGIAAPIGNTTPLLLLAFLLLYVFSTSATAEMREPLWQEDPQFLRYDNSLADARPTLFQVATYQPYALPQPEAKPVEPPGVPKREAKPVEKRAENQNENSNTYGEEQPDQNIQFLRSASVLLNPGQFQFDYGLIYVKNTQPLPISLFPSGVAAAEIEQRSLQVPLAVRYGWKEDIQLSAALPVGWSQSQFSSNGLFDTYDNQVGIGDLELGLNYHCLDASGEYCPDVILSFGLTVPTGDGQFATSGVNQAALAADVWGTSLQVLCIQRCDPIVFFYGAGYRYQFEEDFDGLKVQYGQQFTYNFGVGFAVNERVTLSTSFLGAVETEIQINGQGVPGTIREPLRTRFAATVSRCERIIEPFVEIGMTPAAADAVFGIVWTR